MVSVRYIDVQARPTEFLDFTSLTLDEFQRLVPPFEAAFQAHMAAWCLDGKPRATRRFTVYKTCPLPTPEDRLFFILVYLKTYALQVVQGRLFGMGQSKANQWIHVLLPALLAALRTLGDAPTRSLTALAQRLGVSEADAATMVTPLVEEEPTPGVAVPAASSVSPPFAHDGTERRIVRPQDPAEQATCYSGKKKDHTVKNVLLVNALLLILFLSDTYGGRTHDKPIADATPYPLPAGSRLLQALGFLAFTLPQVEILMPTKKPRGEERTREQHRANQALHQRRLRIEHVNSSVKRCRMVKDQIRLWREGVRDLVLELCCALHNFRVRLNPWLPMI
jgi:hypothetical protein